MTENISSFPKIYLVSNIALALLVFSKSLDPYAISYSFSQTFFELSLWRPITAILYLGRVGILFPFQMIFSYLATSKLAQKVYRKQTTADLVWLLLVSISTLMIFSSFVGLYFYGTSFVMIMFTMWAMQYPSDIINLGRLQVHSVYFPIIYPAVMIAIGSSYKQYMVGFLVGLIVGVLKNPQFIREHGDYLPTPRFIKSFFRFDVYQSQRRRIEQVRDQQQRRYFQGSGHQIGGDSYY